MSLLNAHINTFKALFKGVISTLFILFKLSKHAWLHTLLDITNHNPCERLIV